MLVVVPSGWAQALSGSLGGITLAARRSAMPGMQPATTQTRRTVLGVMLTLLMLALGGPAQGADYYVTSTADNCAAPVAGSLRWAINQANAGGSDNIRFDGLAGTITLACELPPLTDYGTVIMGETADPGGITLEGSGAVSYGIHMAGQACVVRGLTILNFVNYGVLIEPMAGGMARNNIVGGPDSDHRNVIRFNWTGILLMGTVCDSNKVFNNRVGSNTGYGIRLLDGPSDNTIGGLVGNLANSTTLNEYYGIYLANAERNEIVGNYVGTNFGGTMALGNGWDGIHLTGDACSHNIVRGNWVVDNAVNGISLEGGAWENQVTANKVGVDATLAASLGNHDTGVLVTEAAHDNDIGPGNVVSGNEGTGVHIVSFGTDRNDVFQNTIGLNAAEDDSLPNGDAGVHLDGVSDCEVWENIIAGNRGNGVEITNGSFPTHLVRDNIIGTNGTWDPFGNQRDGVHLVQVAAGHEIRANTIAANIGAGILLSETCDNNTIIGNQIGTDPGGMLSLPNQYGIVVRSTENWIGGIDEGEGNIIKYNALDGIRMRNLNTVQIHNRVRGNRIENNGNHGVSIQDGMRKNFIGAENPGDPIEAGNIIHSNASTGIFCGESAALIPPTENRFMSNSITNNGGLGINIQSTVPAGNDGVPAPTIIAASNYGVRGVTNLGGNESTVQVFIDSVDEGETFVGEVTVSGTEDWVYFGTLPEGVNVTATNTGRWPTAGSTFETSEFSSAVLTAVGDEHDAFVPAVFRMKSASPNPFGYSTEIRFEVPRAAPVSLKVYDATGRLVRTLLDGPAEPGTHGAVWDARDDRGVAVAPGVYFCRFEHAEGGEMRKVILLR
jgi:hypothetical protein